MGQSSRLCVTLRCIKVSTLCDLQRTARRGMSQVEHLPLRHPTGSHLSNANPVRLTTSLAVNCQVCTLPCDCMKQLGLRAGVHLVLPSMRVCDTSHWHESYRRPARASSITPESGLPPYHKPDGKESTLSVAQQAYTMNKTQ